MNINTYIPCKLLVSIILSLMMSFTAQAADSDNWDFMIEGYLLAATIDGDASIGRVSGVDVKVDFSDILKALELGGMVHAEAFHKSNWGVIFDYAFLRLGDKSSLHFGGVLDATVRQGIMEAKLARRLPLQSGHLDLYAGMRWWDNDFDVDIDDAILPGTISTEIDQNWVDPMVGGRWTHPLSDKWLLILQGDIGGFGVTSEFTSLVSAGFQYKFKEKWVVDLRYTALWVDFEDGTPNTPGSFAYDTVTHGPLIGIIYRF